MKFNATALLMFTLCANTHAAGMSDYTFKIDRTHSVFSMNGFEIMVGKTGGSLYNEFCSDQSVSGPLREIYWDDTYLFLKHAGRKHRNSFPGDTFLEADDTTNVYYTLRRHSDVIAGPFDLQEFSTHLTSIGRASNIKWKALSKARRESFRQNPFQQGVWERIAVAVVQLPGVLFGWLVCYAVFSSPIVISLVIVRKVRHKNWNIEKWWKRGLVGACYVAIISALGMAVVYAYM